MKPRIWLSVLLALGAISGIGCAPLDEDSEVRSSDEGTGEIDIEGRVDALTNWSSSGALADANGAPGARFGRNLSVGGAGNLVAVTRNPLNASTLGTTQVFRRNSSGSWSREFNQTTPIDRYPVVAMGTNWVFVGEPCGTWGTSCKGRVMGYTWTGYSWAWWVQINYADQAWDFGRAVVWHEATNTLAVAGGNQVRTYYIDRYSFVPLSTMSQPATPYTGTAFGASIAVSGYNVAVGAPSGTRYVGNVAYRSPGYVYMFDRSGNLQATLTGVGSEKTDPASGFGTDVSLAQNGARLAVAADEEVGRSLSAYVFSRNSTTGAWTLSSWIGPPQGTSGGSVRVAIDTFLAVTTRAPNSAVTGTLRTFEMGRFGPTLSATFSVPHGWAPVATSARRVAVGQPNYLGDVGTAYTYYGSEPVFEQALSY